MDSPHTGNGERGDQRSIANGASDPGARAADVQLQQQTAWLRATLTSIGDGVIGTDTAARVCFMNTVAESLTGWPMGEAVGRPLPEVFCVVDQESREAVENPALRALREDRVVGLASDTVLVARNGDERPIDDSAAPIRGPAGESLGSILVFRDVSESRRAARERDASLCRERTARADAERSNRLKEEFLGVVSHELRTPLNAILGWIQVLRRRPSPDMLGQGLEVLERNARTQAQLITDLLDTSKMLSGKLQLDVQPIELPVLVDAALAAVRPAAEAKEQQLVSMLEPIGWPVQGDQARLHQVLWNLLINAVKFTPRGGRIEVRVARVGEDVELTVIDNGRGIDAGFLPHVFDRFRQEDGSMTRQHGGLGLGLAIVKHVIELHGGRVQAESAGESLGATFRVFLPIRADVDGARPSEIAPAAAPLPDLSGLHVLVLDDEADALDLAKRVLEECGAHTSLASSVAEALAIVDAEEIDVIVSDIGLPGRDGYDFIGELRRRGLDTPAAAVTAFARGEDRARALQAGYQVHVTKPIEPADLAAAVSALARKAPPRVDPRGNGGG